MYVIYLLLLLSLWAQTSADEQENEAREALPLCPGHLTDVLSFTGFSIQLHPGNEILEAVVKFKTTHRYSTYWFSRVERMDAEEVGHIIAHYNLRDSDDFHILNEHLAARGEGKSTLKMKWSTLQNSTFKQPNMQLQLHRDNGLDTSVFVDLSEGPFRQLSHKQILTNERFEFDQTFSVQQLPPAEYSGNSNDCKMEMIVTSSLLSMDSDDHERTKRDADSWLNVNYTLIEDSYPYMNFTYEPDMYGRGLESFQLKSLRDYPGMFDSEVSNNSSFHEVVTRMEADAKIEARLVLVPDSDPESARYEPQGYVILVSMYDQGMRYPFAVAGTVRKALDAAEAVEVKTDIREGSSFLKSNFFGANVSATLDFYGSMPGELVCVREYTGYSSETTKTAKAYIQVAGSSSVPKEMRRRAARVVQAFSGGVFEWSFFPLRRPAWVLGHESRARCCHKLADGRVLSSPWREVRFASTLRVSMEVLPSRYFSSNELPEDITVTCSASNGASINFLLTNRYMPSRRISHDTTPMLAQGLTLSSSSNGTKSTSVLSFTLTKSLFELVGDFNIACEASKGSSKEVVDEDFYIWGN